MTEEKLEFTRRLLILGNLGILAWIFLAFFGILFYNQILGVLYLLFEVFLIYVILRRLGCSSCYICKTCTKGFGRLVGVFFGRGFVKKESVGNRIGLVVFVYCSLLVIPVAVLYLLLWESFSFFSLMILVGILALGVYSIATWRSVQQFTSNDDLGQVLNE